MISDEVLAMFELSNDLLFGKIPESRYRYYVEESLRLGREAAGRVMAAGWAAAGESGGAAPGEFGGAKDIYDLYREAGIKIIYQEKSGKSYGVSFRAQSEYGKDGSAEVLIYRQSIAELAEHSREVLAPEGEGDGDGRASAALAAAGADTGIDAEKALQVHLAHEYFHYLEDHSSEIKDERTMAYYGNGYVSDYLALVELTRIFGKKRKAGILRCSEIAAHAFAKELTGLKILPNFYDYTYLIAARSVSREDFFRRVREYEMIFAK